LGGPLKRPPRDYYIPKATRETYLPPRPGTGASTAPGAPLKAISTPDLSRLRQAGAPGGGGGFGPGFGMRGPGPQTSIGSTMIAQASKGTIPGQSSMGSQGIGGRGALARLRGITLPRGLTPVETQAYAEIKENGDVDIPSHVIEDLARLGITKPDAIAAIRSLLKKGHLRSREQFQGEPVLEIAR